MNRSRFEKCFANSPSFKMLTDAQLSSLVDSSTDVVFKSGDIIYKQGTPLTHMVILNEGLGKIYLESKSGQDLILTYAKPYHLNGGVGVFVDKIHHSTLRAITECEACFIEIGKFQSILKSNFAFLEDYLAERSTRILHIYHQFSVLTQKNMEGRMAEALMFLRKIVFESDRLQHISKKDLAELTAMTKESAIRVLKEFMDDGIITIDNSTIDIIDVKALKKILKYG